MDSTIVDAETLDELADYAGLKEKIGAITALAMEGKLDFNGALRERVGLLKDLNIEAMHKTLERMKLNPGAESLIRTMKKGGAKCVLVSGGFTFFTGAIAKQVGFDTNHGNTLEIHNEKLTGKVIEPILDKFAKADFLPHLCPRHEDQNRRRHGHRRRRERHPDVEGRRARHRLQTERRGEKGN
jgi:phosphoserine phosphatase